MLALCKRCWTQETGVQVHYLVFIVSCRNEMNRHISFWMDEKCAVLPTIGNLRWHCLYCGAVEGGPHRHSILSSSGKRMAAALISTLFCDQVLQPRIGSSDCRLLHCLSSEN